MGNGCPPVVWHAAGARGWGAWGRIPAGHRAGRHSILSSVRSSARPVTVPTGGFQHRLLTVRDRVLADEARKKGTAPPSVNCWRLEIRSSAREAGGSTWKGLRWSEVSTAPPVSRSRLFRTHARKLWP